jgi:hypothetical protein
MEMQIGDGREGVRSESGANNVVQARWYEWVRVCVYVWVRVGMCGYV